MKLLIVDDSAMVRRLIEGAYRGTVFTQIKTAADGMLAVTMYKQFQPDVVTLDITMPHMDGLAALSQILEHNPHAKVLIVSALADHHTAIESLKRGAAQFICKPFTAEDLKHSLDEVLNPPPPRRARGRRRRRDGGGSGPTTASSNPAVPGDLGGVVPAPEPPEQTLDPSFPAPPPGPGLPFQVQPGAQPSAPSPAPRPPAPQDYPSGYVAPPRSE